MPFIPSTNHAACYTWAEPFNWPEHSSPSQTVISSCNLSRPNPQKSNMLVKGRCKSTHEYSQHNPLEKGLSHISVLPWKIPVCLQLHLLHTIQMPKCSGTAQWNNSAVATEGCRTFDCCTSQVCCVHVELQPCKLFCCMLIKIAVDQYLDQFLCNLPKTGPEPRAQYRPPSF